MAQLTVRWLAFNDEEFSGMIDEREDEINVPNEGLDGNDIAKRIAVNYFDMDSSRWPEMYNESVMETLFIEIIAPDSFAGIYNVEVNLEYNAVAEKCDDPRPKTA